MCVWDRGLHEVKNTRLETQTLNNKWAWALNFWKIELKWFGQSERKEIKLVVRFLCWHPWYSVFQGFSKAKFANGGLILSSSQFSILPQIAQKMKLASKVVKVDSKIIISLPKI